MATSLLSVVGSVASGVLGRNAAKAQASAAERAGNNQAASMLEATDKSIGFQREMFDYGKEVSAPFIETGTQALGRLSDVFLDNDFSGFEESPGYQFAFDEGRRALERGAASRGLLNSGATGRALVDYGTGMASQEFGNWANRLASLAGIGQATAGQQAGIGAQVGANLGNTAQQGGFGAGTAAASGLVGAANARAAGQQQFAQGIGGAFGAAEQGINRLGDPFDLLGGGGNSLIASMFSSGAGMFGGGAAAV